LPTSARSTTSARRTLQAALQWLANPTVRPIVGIREFIESPYYMNAPKAVWPGIMTELEECCSGKYSEAIWTGSIGGGKTTAALYAHRL
jgi:hypothetical protein